MRLEKLYPSMEAVSYALLTEYAGKVCEVYPFGQGYYIKVIR